MASTDEHYDLIIVGGGIYGLMLGLEASLRGIKALLLERNDWGGGTSYNWLRILHGGLRYLQTADLIRFNESVRERAWFLRYFPDLVSPLPCVMPLYENGSRSSHAMRAALAMNDILSARRNVGITPACRLGNSRILRAPEVVETLPYVDAAGLGAGALWFDAVVTAPQALLWELLSWARREGLSAANYTEVTKILRSGDHVTGVEARAGAGTKRFQAPVVVNTTGHSSPATADQFGFAITEPPAISWAWNVLVDVASDASAAGAVTARRRGAQTFFILPWHGQTLVGTGHAPAPEGKPDEPLPQVLLDHFLGEVDEAVPQLGLRTARIARLFHGCLPVHRRRPDKLTSRPMIVDHRANGVSGLYSVWGIKFTTARAVARRVLRMAFGSPGKSSKGYARSAPHYDTRMPNDTFKARYSEQTFNRIELQRLTSLDRGGDVQHLDDLVFRRTGLGDDPARALSKAREIVDMLPWDAQKKQDELSRLDRIVHCALGSGEPGC